MDFAEPCPLVRPGLPIFGFCSSGRSFASALLSDGASRRPPLRLASPLSHRTWAEDFHLQAVKHARHTQPHGNHKTVSTGRWKSRKEREIPTFAQPLFVLLKREEQKTREQRLDQPLTVSVATPVVAGFEVSINGRFSGVHRGCAAYDDRTDCQGSPRYYQDCD